jgi:hypothetical protein
MHCIVREKLFEHSLKLADISNLYLSDGSRFVNMYLEWLDETEKDLSRLRSPVCILLQAEKSSLRSILDGYIPDNIQQGRNTRKILRAYAAQSLEKISREFYSKIGSIDHYFDEQSEKLCHAVAVLVSKRPNIKDDFKTDQNGIDYIWKLLGDNTETIPIFNYFCSKLALADRNYLMLDILQKFISNIPIKSD